jgi:hypothetical protein
MATDNDPGLFGRLPPQLSPEERWRAKHLRWQETIVKKLLRFYGLGHTERELRNRCADRTGNHYLLFCWFHDEHPTFPVWFAFRKVRYLHELTLEDYLHRFSKTPLFAAWTEAWEQAPEHWLAAGQPIALAFESLHGMGAAVLTDCERPLADDSTRLVKSFRGVPLYMESLDQFLTGLGWQPS